VKTLVILIISILSLAFLLKILKAQENLPTLPSPIRTILAPQPMIGNTEPTVKTKKINVKEIELKVEAPPESKVTVPIAIRGEINKTQSDYQFRIPSGVKTVKVNVEGPFGGKVIRELKMNEISGDPLKISEKQILNNEDNPDPSNLSDLPEMCPRLVPENLVASKDWHSPIERKELLPENAVYDGRRDPLSAWAEGKSNLLYFKSATLTFDFEDPSVMVGYNHQTGELVFESQGGFYSNIHYILLPYSSQLENLYREMEPDFVALRRLEKDFRDHHFEAMELRKIQSKLKEHYDNLYGTKKELGPYQILMHLVFGTLEAIGKNDLSEKYGKPIAHGFLSGPFRGSSHWGYCLCEWGDTSFHAPLQKMRYENMALGQWSRSFADEKVILILLEGDEQLKPSQTRHEWEEKGIIRPFDYTDDLIGFFVVPRSETLQGEKTFSSPFQELSFQLLTR
jgi:hypothetical protein